MGTAIVTGASSGIGLELARLLAADRQDLVLVARNRGALEQLGADLSARHGIRAWSVAADLADPDAPAAIMEQCAGAGDITCLVNNAGFGHLGPFAASPPARNTEMLQVNIAALTQLTRLVLPGMVARRRGRVLNVASTAAFQPGPLMAVYYASKSYVVSFSVALSLELEGTGVTCTVLCPGPTRTTFHASAGAAPASGALAMDAATVARAGYRGMLRGTRIVTPGWLNRIGAAGARLAPFGLAARMALLRQRLRNR